MGSRAMIPRVSDEWASNGHLASVSVAPMGSDGFQGAPIGSKGSKCFRCSDGALSVSWAPMGSKGLRLVPRVLRLGTVVRLCGSGRLGPARAGCPALRLCSGRLSHAVGGPRPIACGPRQARLCGCNGEGKWERKRTGPTSEDRDEDEDSRELRRRHAGLGKRP